MKVFKFGGASVKNAEGVKNVIKVLEQVGDTNIIIVVSAMGKITNALEKVVNYYVQEDAELMPAIDAIKSFHVEIVSNLFGQQKEHVLGVVNELFTELQITLQCNKSSTYNYVYDQIVSYGELLSTAIVSQYLTDRGYINEWVDARLYVKTDSTYRDATVDWEATQQKITNGIRQQGLYVTQGFIGANSNGFTTTLGREGSDYSAGIFAYCVNAESVSIWKDVPGVLNGDPRVFENTLLLSHISYEEAIELAFYGASVIHPKTLQPLQRKEIPLYVKSFIDPTKQGTSVKKGQALIPYIPCYIVKKNLILMSLSSLDFSFIVEDAMSAIFNLFHHYQLKVDLIQNSAISFSVCLDDKYGTFYRLLEELQAKYRVVYNEQVSLYTIRHFTDESIGFLEGNHNIILKQITRETYQMVVKQ